MPTSLLKSLFAIVQSTLLLFDPYLWVPLEQEAGKRLLLSIEELGDFGLELHEKQICLIEVTQPKKAQQTYHCSVEGRLTAFLDLTLKDQHFIPGNGITILGDFQLAQRFFQCFISIDPDWMHLLSDRIPKPLNALLHTLLNPLILEIQRWNIARHKDLQTFLIDELQALPSKAALFDLETQIAALHRQSEHLEAKLATLMQTFDPSKI